MSRTEQKKIKADLELQKRETLISRAILDHLAIATHNSVVTTRMTANFRQKLAIVLNKPKFPLNLDVLPTSVRAFWDKRGHHPTYLYFPKSEYTGVPAVSQYIHRISLGRREQLLDGQLSGYRSVLDGLKTWSDDDKTPLKIAVDREQASRVFDDVHDIYSAVSR